MIIQWIRRLLGLTREQSTTDFEKQHFAKFEEALKVSDVRVFVYDDFVRGERLILKGCDLHCVTVHNLISFHKLNRQERRKLNKHYAVN